MDNIDIRKFYEILVAASKSLNDNKDYLNSLNVFPVPDGDTGTNMSATFSEAVKAINFNDDSTAESITASLSKGALLGARGNSGVILSQILRGLSKGFVGAEVINVSCIANSLKLACESAYNAVMKPKEGTILTVVKGASESAKLNSNKSDILDFIDCVLVDTKSTLIKTRDMLPENKSAGTVDAGGAGFVVILQAFSDVLHGNIEITEFNFNESKVTFDFQDIHPSFEDIKFQYCTEFIIKSEVNESVLRERLDSLGDSIVVVSMDGITKVHVHTNEPGTALNIAMEYGELTRMKIDNMKEQSEANPSNNVAKPAVKSKQAVIAVASGLGIENMLLDAGATKIISGGQSMNPSVEDIVEAIKAVNAENVIILPNNKNIILSAEQASQIVDCNVFVVKSTTIPQGVTALISYDGSGDFDENCEAMVDAINNVITCQVTTAVKDSNIGGLAIKQGEILGLKEDSIICSSKDYTSVILELFEDCVTDDISLATVIIGSEITNDYVEEIQDILEEKYDDIDICFSQGDQEVYPFIISFE